jgi:hypothetical protein
MKIFRILTLAAFVFCGLSHVAAPALADCSIASGCVQSIVVGNGLVNTGTPTSPVLSVDAPQALLSLGLSASSPVCTDANGNLTTTGCASGLSANNTDFTGTTTVQSIVDTGLSTNSTVCTDSNSQLTTSNYRTACPTVYMNGSGSPLPGSHIEIFNNQNISSGGGTQQYEFGTDYNNNNPICVATPSNNASTYSGLLIIQNISEGNVTVENNTGVSQTPQVICIGF